jgi:hypothetical protein
VFFSAWIVRFGVGAAQNLLVEAEGLCFSWRQVTSATDFNSDAF